MYAALQNRSPMQDIGLVVDENLELVKRIAWRLHQRLPDCVQIEDLIQAGTIGLLEAWERYQPDEEASFSTFAGIRIRGAMLDEIRRGDWAPRSLHRAARAVKQARADVERRCGRAAASTAVAEEMGMPLNEYRRLCDDVALAHVGSLDSALSDQPALEVSAGDRFAPEAAVEYQDMCEAIQRAAVELPEREQLLMHLYYESGQNLRQIAEQLGVSESRICQLHGRAIRQIRALVGEAA
ncbi:RNA polymerase, sigma 28 subunit, FliA/WhiG [Salinisphaera dokdonensis CL-ES53]|uniref:RNA polymerase, sigma 28 subunit, FliA/WhiG n=1 Tax=Salinisphaera dokdonensis CL-ES53 TaxID=1304272 RepID=A0ABV2B1X4_9GAMM